MPEPSGTNVMSVTLRDTEEGPFLVFSPQVLRIRKGTGPNRFDRITLKYEPIGQQDQSKLEKRDPDGSKKLAKGAIEFKLTGNTDMFTAGGQATFILTPGQQKTLTLKAILGLQPGGSFEAHPNPAIAKTISIEHEFPGVTDPDLALGRDHGNHPDWHVEC